MVPDAERTTEELLAAWRVAETAINDTAEGTAERSEATQAADEAREAYQLLVDTLAMDLRDG